MLRRGGGRHKGEACCTEGRARLPGVTDVRPCAIFSGMTRLRSTAIGILAAAPVLVGTCAFAASPLASQQVADSAFAPVLGPPAWTAGAGPRVALDEAHWNFHTLDGRYLTFGRVLASDGFRVGPLREPFTAAALDTLDVLVIANALHASNATAGAWALPTPSAFTPEEIAAVRRWVEGGGALLVIADHMPFAGAAGDLAAVFGFELRNGFAQGPGQGGPGLLVFRRSDGSLADHPVTRGATPVLRVDSVASFTGEALRAPAGAISLLTLPQKSVSLEPDTAWIFGDATPRTDVSGWSQGAVAEVGRGRVAGFGEAAMFSAQLAGPQQTPMGMNSPVAAHNPRLLMNLVRWLAGAAERE